MHPYTNKRHTFKIKAARGARHKLGGGVKKKTLCTNEPWDIIIDDRYYPLGIASESSLQHTVEFMLRL